MSLDKRGRYSDTEVAAAANHIGVWPQSQAEVDRLMGTMAASALVLRMRARTLANVLLAPLRKLMDRKPCLFWAIFWADLAALSLVLTAGLLLRH